MSDEEKDPKEGDQKQPSGDGQPDKKETSSEKKVEISESELKTLQKKSQDFDGIVEAKRKKEASSRTFPGAEPESKKQKAKDDDFNGDDDDDLKQEFVTKKDFQKTIEKQAVAELHKNSDIADNWDDIMEFWTPRSTDDRETIDGLVAIGNRAFKVWKAQQPTPKKVDDGSSKATANVATDTGLGKGKDKSPENTEKKSILRKKENMTEWYGKDKK